MIGILLTGCQASPEKNIVVSKRDSAGMESKRDSQTIPDEEKISDTVTHVQSSKSFCTTDGTIDIFFNLDEDIQYDVLPIYTVTPHYILSLIHI